MNILLDIYKACSQNDRQNNVYTHSEWVGYHLKVHSGKKSICNQAHDKAVIWDGQ